MSGHTCDGDNCIRCEARISRIEDARNGVDFDRSGSQADFAADEHFLGRD